MRGTIAGFESLFVEVLEVALNVPSYIVPSLTKLNNPLLAVGDPKRETRFRCDVQKAVADILEQGQARAEPVAWRANEHAV